jgi:tripartite-type tricarboxylate transporter receptor subunit TctC
MIRTAALLAAALVLASATAHAQTYPSKPITLVIPFAAGGSNDIVGRAIGRKLTEIWGQPVVVENRSGAGGLIGSTDVAASPPDGYTLLLVSSTFTINPAIRKRMPFDTIKDFTPVAFIARSPLLLTASNKLAVKSAGELLALARSKPGQITYASSGLGSINQIAAELIALSAGARFTHIPYKGGAPALNDLIGGHVDIYVSSLPQVLKLAQAISASRCSSRTGSRRRLRFTSAPSH